MKLYVVHMRRWGDEENHSYIEGVYDNEKDAEKHGLAEQESRDNKYEPQIRIHILNEPRPLKYKNEDEIEIKTNNLIQALTRKLKQ
jgi:hypothetical protein